MSQSKHHNRRRKDSSREPPTIDLKATVVDEGRATTAPAQESGEAPGAVTSAPNAAQGSEEASVPATSASDAGGAPTATAAEGASDRGGAAPASPSETVPAAGESIATSDMASAPVDIRTPFVTSLETPPTVDATSTPAALPGGGAPASGAEASSGDAAQAMDDGRLPQPSSVGSDVSDVAGPPGAPTPDAGPEGTGPDTMSDGTAVANEGPAPAAGAAGAAGEGTTSATGSGGAEEGSASARPDRDAADPTVPVADQDFSRPSRGSVPPVSGVGAAPAPARRSPGFGALAGAGLLGGLVGAGLLYGLQTWRSAQAPADPRLAQIEQRLGALPRADAVQGIDRRIATLEAAQSDLSQRIGATQSLAERAAARAEEAASRPASAAPSGAPDASGQPVPAAGPGPDLANRLAALESQVRDPAAVTDLANRLGSLETQLRERAEATATADQALERRLTETSQSLEQRLNETVQRLEGRVAETGQTLERRLTETGQTLDRRLAETDQRTQALARQLAEWNPEAIRAGLRVVLADRLNDAINQGAPFADVLGSLRGFAIAPERVQALEPLAASGAPTAAALRQDFDALAERIERAARGEAEGVVDRLWRMADKVVSVRAVGDPNSTAVPDLVARIENALDRGALREAIAAWDALPEASRRVADDWGRRLKARVAADEAARGIASDAIAALNASGRR